MSSQRVRPRTNDLWVELVYEHDEEVPAELLAGITLTKIEVSAENDEDVCVVTSGWPEIRGEYLFWYGPRLELLGWTHNNSKHKKAVAKLSRCLLDTDSGTISGGKGRNGFTWAVSVIKKDDPNYRELCLLFVEKREIKGRKN